MSSQWLNSSGTRANQFTSKHGKHIDNKASRERQNTQERGCKRCPNRRSWGSKDRKKILERVPRTGKAQG